MTEATLPSPADIRAFRAANPKLRERDIAEKLGISEAALVAAECGLGTVRIDADPNRFLPLAKMLGEVMALTRNASAVHEKIGVYENVSVGKQATILLGPQIDLRVFGHAWAHGFAVTKETEDGPKRSFQFFDAQGTAIHKVHLRAASDVEAFERIITHLRSDDQSQTLATVPAASVTQLADDKPLDPADLRSRWTAMTDTHQFHGILRKLDISRRQALHAIGDDFAWQLDPTAIEAMLTAAAADGLPIMCFVGNPGMIQIHSGPVTGAKTMGPWLNIMDPDFHLHLRIDHLAEVWAVRKPTADGHVTSLEALDANGEMVIQFFGKRIEGAAERESWRTIMEDLARLDRTVAA